MRNPKEEIRTITPCCVLELLLKERKISEKKKKKKKKGKAEGCVSPIAAVHKRSKERIDNSDINSITKRKTRTSLGKHRQCIKFDKIC